MSKWTMITLSYQRVPKTTKYVGDLTVTTVQSNGEMLTEMLLSTKHWVDEVDLGVMVEEIHKTLQTYPEGKVTMLQGLTRPGMHRKLNRDAYELTSEEANTVRNNLPKALEMFAPIEQTIKIQTKPPSVELGVKETEDAR
jgi:hypothetical protein